MGSQQPLRRVAAATTRGAGRRGRIAALCAGLAVAGTGVLAAPAAHAHRQEVVERFVETRPGTSTAREFAVDFFAHREGDHGPEDRGRPPRATQVDIAFHKGARFDGEAIARCQASNADLQAHGWRAKCPDSKMGTNVVTIDTGFPDPWRSMGTRDGLDSPRYLTSVVTVLNGRWLPPANEVILLAESTVPRALGPLDEHFEPVRALGDPYVRFRLVMRATITREQDGRDHLVIAAGFIPGMPPEGGARKQERLFFPENNGLLTTPPKCPRTGYWTNTVTYTYDDDPASTPLPPRRTSTETSEYRSPCVHGRGDGLVKHDD